MVELPGSGCFLGTLLRMKVEHSSPRVTMARYSNFDFLESIPLRYLEYLGMWVIASRKGMLRWSFRSISMKPPHSTSNFSLCTLVGKGMGGMYSAIGGGVYSAAGGGVSNAFLATPLFSPEVSSSPPSGRGSSFSFTSLATTSRFTFPLLK
ncbi:unnamed protein product [Linum trigynum]|uniref:Uncharacterized protein n=1 Tax=Linum trigynum TaxID=586398 RepID=A0AAV2FW59_9ROSI